MSSLLHYPRLLQPEAIRVVRDPEPIRVDERERDQATWVEGLVAYHRSQAEESATDPIGTHELLADRLDVLARTLRGQNASGITAHDVQEGSLPSWWANEIDRRLIGLRPLRQFASLLARCILDEAALLTPYDTAAKRLVVRRLLNLATDVEGFRAEDAWSFARDYEDAKATTIADLCSGVW